MKHQDTARKPPGRLATATRRVRQYPARWLGQYKQGRDEGRERANRARDEYQEVKRDFEARSRDLQREAPPARQRGRTR